MAPRSRARNAQCFYLWMAVYLIAGMVLGMQTMRQLAAFQNTVLTPRAAVRQYWYIIKRQAVSLVLFFAVFVAVLCWGVVYAACQIADKQIPFWVSALAMVAVTSPSLDCFLLFGATQSTWRFLRLGIARACGCRSERVSAQSRRSSSNSSSATIEPPPSRQSSSTTAWPAAESPLVLEDPAMAHAGYMSFGETNDAGKAGSSW